MAFFNALAMLLVASASLIAESPEEIIDSTPQKQFMTDKAVFCRTGMYCAAQQAGMGNRALSLINVGSDGLVLGAELAPEAARIAEEVISHPLHDAHIIMLNTVAEKPLCVTEENPYQLVLVDSLATTTPEVKVFNPVDAHGTAQARIIGLTAGVTGYAEHSNFVNYIIMAVAPNTGIFGDAGSGFSVVKNTRRGYTEKVKNAEGQERDIDRVEVLYTAMSRYNESIQTAFPFDSQHAALPVADGFGRITSENIAFGWCTDVCRFYVGLHIENDSSLSANQGMHALLRGRIQDDQLILEPVANVPTPFTAMGAGAHAAVYHIRSLYTSTGNPYLVVVGGTGDPEHCAQQVSAMPLVHKGRVHSDLLSYNADTENGLFAASNAMPQLHTQKISFQTTRHYARGLRIENPATDSDTMPHANDRAVCVGAGVPLPSAITALEIVNDAVYVAVGHDGNGQKAGIFHSQPIFDAVGKIAAWTPWQRAFGIFESVVGMQLDPKKSLAKIIKAEHNPLTRMAHTAWSHKRAKPTTSHHLEFVLKDFFPADEGGILQLADYMVHDLGGPIGERSTFMIATGAKKIALIETGHDVDGFFTAYPNVYDASIMIMDQGAIDYANHDCAHELPVLMIVSGGALDELGALSHTAIIHKDGEAWLVVAGLKGLAILCDEAGHGWRLNAGIGKHAAQLAGMRFKRFGSFDGIKKIMAHNGAVRVLTAKQLVSISLQAESIAKNTPTSHLIASADTMGGFFDAVIDDTCVFIGTTQGLFATPNYRTHEFSSISLPNMFGVPYSFFTVSNDGYNKGFAHGGQLYVMVGSVQKQASAVYRLYCDIDDQVMPIGVVPSYEYEAAPGAFMIFNSYRNCFVTNGSTYFSAHPKKAAIPPLLKVYGMSEIYSAHIEAPDIFVAPLRIEKFKRISSIVQNSTTGAWYFAGDFGMRMNG